LTGEPTRTFSQKADLLEVFRWEPSRYFTNLHEALRSERQHQLYAAENALKGAEDRAKWLQLRARQENWAVYPTSEIEDILRRGKELKHGHVERARKVAEQMERLAVENRLPLPPLGQEKALRVNCACCGFLALKNAYRVGDVWVGPECVNHYPPSCGKELA